MSALLPTETNADRPRPRPATRSSNARPSAPLWDEKPIEPAGNDRGANVAFNLDPATAMPRQFGPNSRAPWARTAASSRSCRSRPSAPVSAKPADITQIARIPAVSACSAASITLAAGTQITARSTGAGRSPTEAAAGTPATGSPRRLTGCTEPPKSAASRFRTIELPMLPRRDEAPMTATLRGAKNSRREATVARWSRSSTPAMYESVAVIGKLSSAVPCSTRRVTSNPAPMKTLSIASFATLTSATKRLIPAEAAISTNCSSSRVPTPFPCIGSSTANATSAAVGSRSLSKLPSATTCPSDIPISAPRSSPCASR